MDMAEKMSYNPAQILGLTEKGAVAEGKIADLVIFDPDANYKIDKNTFYFCKKYNLNIKERTHRLTEEKYTAG